MIARKASVRILGAVCTPLLAIVFAPSTRAQDADTNLLRDDNQKFTLVSQIGDRKEADAFLRILEITEPAARHFAAQEFAARYPRSWMLPQIYDICARTAIDEGKYEEALASGHFSLRLQPENPSLLILMANVEAERGLGPAALQDANDALEYLNLIERPPNMTQSDWNSLRPQMESAAFFARARIKALQGLRTHEVASLKQADLDLNKAAAWNHTDAEVFYLRAVVALELGDRNGAASDLAFVLQSPPPLQEKAKRILTILSRGKAADIEAFVKALPPRRIDATLRDEVGRTDSPEVLAAGYAGPQRCAPCHAKEYENWRKTGMARMLQPYKRENVIGDFSGATVYGIRLGIEGRPYFEFEENGQKKRFYVDATTGSKWQQGYATRLEDGRLQVLPIEYNLLKKAWINYWAMIDPPGSARAVVADFPKLTPATNYEQNCAVCHTSQLRLPPAASDGVQHASFLQPGIDCEMCHGPSALHATKATAGAVQGSELPFDFRKATNRDGVRVCAQCHRQSAIRSIGKNGEMNYATEVSFVPSTSVRSYDAFSRKAFYKDGRFRETTFIVDAFTRSACYRRGTAQCASCHSPHLANFDNNKTSLKHVENPNEMCLSCHSQFRDRIAQHSRHAVGTEASQCVSCHMPRIMNALLFQARSHQIEIPTADLTERFGQEESPNACLMCHADRGAAWAKQQLEAWPH